MSDTIQDLRSELFATLRALRDKEDPMEIARAEAIAGVAQTIINSAKVEVDAMKISGANIVSKFLAHEAIGSPPNQPSCRHTNTDRNSARHANRPGTQDAIAMAVTNTNAVLRGEPLAASPLENTVMHGG